MVNWDRKWAVFGFCQKLKISRNQIMIESDHKSWTLFLSPRQKVGGGKWWARSHKHFFAAQNLKIIFKSYAFLHNSLRDFWIFVKRQNRPFSRPIYQHTGLNTEKKSNSTTIGTEKRKKCTSQIFYFWNFITHFFKSWKDFNKSKSTGP